MRKLSATFTLLLSIIFHSSGQSSSHRLTPAEQNAMPDYLKHAVSPSLNGITTPPSSTVRASAEWEEIDALVVVWTSYTTIVRQIIEAARTETRVIVVCSDSNVVKNNLILNAVPLSNISYLVTAFNSIWCRDYGPWNVYTQDVDSLFLIDWIYNRPRPKDDTLPASIARAENLPMYQTTVSPYDLIHTGGNFMCDGMGTGFSSNLILNENPTKTAPQIDSIMNSFMGINRYIKMNTLPYDQIHHIDMHMKLLDEETILMGEYPAGIADGPTIEANLNYVLSNFNSPFGTPYKVVRMPMPPDANGNYPNAGGDYRTYTNAVFVNKTILLPFYEQQYDTIAKRVWEEAMPGYRVVGIDCNQIIPSLGAIHCITKEVSTGNPMLIIHQPLHDQLATTSHYIVNAMFKHRSGINSAELYYRTDTLQPFTMVTMNATGTGDNFTASIPGQPAGSIVYYYLKGISNSGKTLCRPLPAPAGHWKFTVIGSTGMEQPEAINIGTVFPNPSHGNTCLPIFSKSNQHISVQLKTMNGTLQTVLFEGDMTAGEKRIWFNTQTLPSGIYIIEATGSGMVSRQKLIIH